MTLSPVQEDIQQQKEKQGTGFVSTVYGPVESWRFGQSLGIDLIRDTSTCSFNCIYCQLGDIQDKTMARRLFVPTSQILSDLDTAPWQGVDVITFSGSGEPTLALNCGEAIQAVKAKTGKTVMVLTNGTLLHQQAVREELMAADHVAVKLDAPDEKTLHMMNRPVAGVSLEQIVNGAIAFRRIYKGKLSVQCMFMPANLKEAEALVDLILAISPDEIQLNTPKRPYPLEWVVETRGNHGSKPSCQSVELKTVSTEQADALETLLAEKTGIPVLSIYRKAEVQA